MVTPTQMDEAVSKNKRKTTFKRIKDEILKTIETCNKVFVSLHVGVMSNDNITA